MSELTTEAKDKIFNDINSAIISVHGKLFHTCLYSSAALALGLGLKIASANTYMVVRRGDPKKFYQYLADVKYVDRIENGEYKPYGFQHYFVKGPNLLVDLSVGRYEEYFRTYSKVNFTGWDFPVAPDGYFWDNPANLPAAHRAFFTECSLIIPIKSHLNEILKIARLAFPDKKITRRMVARLFGLKP